MANILPFQRTQILINEIDEYLDKVSEATMVLETTILHHIEEGNEVFIEEKLQQIFAIETRGDEVRRSIATEMYAQMLMPDTRGDVLNLLEELDNVLDDSTHLIAAIAIERPELDIPETFRSMFSELTTAVVKAAQCMVQAARAYFKAPHAVRDHVHKISFHEMESTKITVRLGKEIYKSDISLERKRLLVDLAVRIRELASHANDVGDRTAIFAVKRSL